MTDYKTLSDSELTEALNFHRRQRNMSRGINEAAHMRQTQVVRLLEAEEARRLEEATKPNQYIEVTNKFTGSKSYHEVHPSKAFAALNHHNGLWNTKAARIVSGKEAEDIRTSKMKKEEVAISENIGGLFKDASEWERSAKSRGLVVKSATHPSGEMTKYQIAKDKEGNNRGHFDHGTKSGHLKEEVEQIDELSKKTLGSYVKKASTDQYLKGQAVQYHTNKAQTADGAFAKQSKEKHYDAADKALKKASNRDTGIGRAVDRLTKEEVEQIDELSKDTLNSYWKKAATARYPLDVKARKAQDQKTNRIRSGKPLAGYKPKDELSADEKRTHMNRIKGMNNAGKRLFRSEEVEQIDEISDDLKRRYHEKGREDVYNRFTGRGKYEKPRNPDNFTKTGRPKKSALNSPESIKYREKIQSRNKYLTKVANHLKMEEVELDEASYRDIGYANMLKADRKAEKELAKLRAQQEKAKAKAAAKASKPEEFKEEASDLRITKVYNKWPKPATYAVHNADRSYHKEFDSMEAAQAHKAEKSK